MSNGNRRKSKGEGKKNRNEGKGVKARGQKTGMTKRRKWERKITKKTKKRGRKGMEVRERE